MLQVAGAMAKGTDDSNAVQASGYIYYWTVPSPESSTLTSFDRNLA